MNGTLAALVAEFVATFTLTFVGAGAILVNGSGIGGGGIVAIAIAHGLALSVAVYASGHISGGHVNPAVTCAMLATRRIGAGKAVGYIIAQLAGAVVGALAVKQLVQPYIPADAAASLMLGATLGATRTNGDLFVTIIVEAIATFLLVTTIFGVAVDGRGPKNVYGFAIGLTVAADILIAGPITGASMNPARSFGPALVGGHWELHSAYWLGPILGGVIAGLVYQTVHLARAPSES